MATGMDRLLNDVAFQRPRGARFDRAVLLAHGAGADMDAAPLRAVADALEAAGIPSLRFNYPYRSAGKKAPDRAPALEAATREAVALLASKTKLSPERLVLGGRSMGGRYCSMLAGSMLAGAAENATTCLGLLLLGYPLHPAGKPLQLRIGHFPRLRVPVLFVSGTRDALASRAALTKAAKEIKGKTAFHWLDDADHGFRVPKRAGRSADDVLGEVATAAVNWVIRL